MTSNPCGSEGAPAKWRVFERDSMRWYHRNCRRVEIFTVSKCAVKTVSEATAASCRIYEHTYVPPEDRIKAKLCSMT